MRQCHIHDDWGGTQKGSAMQKNNPSHAWSTACEGPPEAARQQHAGFTRGRTWGPGCHLLPRRKPANRPPGNFFQTKKKSIASSRLSLGAGARVAEIAKATRGRVLSQVFSWGVGCACRRGKSVASHFGSLPTTWFIWNPGSLSPNACRRAQGTKEPNAGLLWHQF